MIVIHDQSSFKSLAQSTTLHGQLYHSKEEPLNVNLEQYCTIFTTSIKQADTWEGPKGVRLIEVSMYTQIVLL